MRSLLSIAWINSDTPMVSEMKMIVLRKKLVTEHPEVNGVFVQKVLRETLMAMRTFLVSATLEAGKLVVQKVWKGDFNVDAAKEAIAQCVKVLNIIDSTSSIWHYRLLAGRWDKTGDKFKEWRSQGSEYVKKLELQLLELESEGSDPLAIISKLREMKDIRQHFEEVQWDDFKARWNQWGCNEDPDDWRPTLLSLQEERTAWSGTSGSPSVSSEISEIEQPFVTVLNDSIRRSILTKASALVTQDSISIIE